MGELRWPTFADVTEPHILERTSALAVHTLKLVGTNDDIRKRSTVLKNEDSRIGSSVVVSVAGTSTVVLLVAHILHSRNTHGGTEGVDAADTGGNVERLGCAESCQDGGKDGGLEKHVESVGRTVCVKECSVNVRSKRMTVNECKAE
jgi:hypothetical protein